MNASHRLGVARHATTTTAKAKVAAANSPRTASPPGYRYQIAIEHQTPINKMAIANREKPIQRTNLRRIGFTAEAPQHDR